MMMQMVGSFAEFERAMIRERTSAGLAAARAEGRVGGRRKKLDAAMRREIAESVITGRKSGAEMARLYNVSQPTVSRIVAQHRATVWYRQFRSPTIWVSIVGRASSSLSETATLMLRGSVIPRTLWATWFGLHC